MIVTQSVVSSRGDPQKTGIRFSIEANRKGVKPVSFVIMAVTLNPKNLLCHVCFAAIIFALLTPYYSRFMMPSNSVVLFQLRHRGQSIIRSIAAGFFRQMDKDGDGIISLERWMAHYSVWSGKAVDECKSKFINLLYFM